VGATNIQVMSVYERIKIDAFVRNQKTPFSVIPAKAGIQEIQEVLDSRSPHARGQASRE